MKQITCENYHDLILKDLDQGLDLNEEQRLKGHIRNCDKCAQTKTVYGQIFKSLPKAAPEDPGEIFWAKGLKDLNSKIREKEKKRNRGWGWAPAYVAASVILIISVSLYGLWNISFYPFMDVAGARSIALELDHVYGPVGPENEIYTIHVVKGKDLDIKFALDDPSMDVCWFEVEETAYNSIM